MTHDPFEWRTAKPPRSGWWGALAGVAVLSGLGAVYLYASPYFASRTTPLSEPARSVENEKSQAAPTVRPPNAVATAEPAPPERPAVVEAKPSDAPTTAPPPVPAVVLNKGAHEPPSPEKERGEGAAANTDRLARAPVEEPRGAASEERRPTRGYRRARVQERPARPSRERLAREPIEDDPPPPDVDAEDYESLRAEVLRESLRSPDR